MEFDRRTFLKFTSALSVALAVPIKLEAATAVPAVESGLYALMAFHQELVARKSVFTRVSHSLSSGALREYGIPQDDLIWAKIRLIEVPNHEDDGGTHYHAMGGRLPIYYAACVIACADGKAIKVMKNRGGTMYLPPEQLHYVSTPTLLPYIGQGRGDYHKGWVGVN